MDKNINLDKLTNAELNIYMKTLENEYNSLKIKVKNALLEMEKLDELYLNVKNVLYNRTRGKI